MAVSRLIVVICDNYKPRRAMIRGYLTELADSELAGDLTGLEGEGGVAIDGGRAGVTWGRPVLSAPNISVTVENPTGRLCAWGLWGSTLPEGGNTKLTTLSQSHAEIRVFRQQIGTGETLDQFRARWRAGVNWVDRSQGA